MKAYQKTLIALAATSALAMSANAAISYGGSSAGQPYVGVKVGQFDVDYDGADNPTAYGIYGGYNFDQNFGAEIEYVGSDDADITLNGQKGEFDAKSYGAYGTYRYHFNNTPIYAKGKLGIAKTELEATSANFSASEDKTSLAGGVAIGFKPTANFNIEAGYNYLNSDVNMWGVGAHLNF